MLCHSTIPAVVLMIAGVVVAANSSWRAIQFVPGKQATTSRTVAMVSTKKFH